MSPKHYHNTKQMQNEQQIILKKTQQSQTKLNIRTKINSEMINIMKIAAGDKTSCKFKEECK